jgi:cobalt/nickel transport system ATP-binding protein
VNKLVLFSFRNITYGYHDDIPILKNLSFTIEEGKKTAIVGANGAGKSTILYHMNGLYVPNSGEITFRGRLVNRDNRKDLVRSVGIVFQDPDDQIFSLTVKEDVAFGPAQFGVGKDEIENRVNKYLRLLNIEHLAERNPAELSYGQKKYVAIAGILAMETDVFILDEPMAFLDPKGREQMQHILQLLEMEGKSLIITTHDMQFVAEWADEIIVIHEGQCLGKFSPRELFFNDEIIKKARLSFPIVFQLMKHIWGGDPEEIPIKVEEAKNWLEYRIKKG